ncbi:hypothetical protein [Desulfurobacterium sp.]
MDSLKKIILQWFKEKIDKKEYVEVVSFYDEIPVKVKMNPISIEEFKVIGWEANPKIIPAIDQTQKFYITFFHPEYREKKYSRQECFTITVTI